MANEDKTAQDKGEETEQKPAQVRGRLLSDDESHEWGQSIQIEEKPFQANGNALREEFEQAHKGDNEETQEETEEDTETDSTTEDDETEQPQEFVTVEDPGEFTPANYSFDVTVYDAEGNKPKTVKVNSIDEWDTLLESEPNLGSSVALSRAFRAAQKMELGADRDRQAYDKQKKEYDDAVAEQQQREIRGNTIFGEISYLIERGDLPKLTREERDVLDWNDPAVVKAHPNIAAHNDLLKYMRKENANRVKLKLAPIQSALDAFNAMQLDTRRQSDAQKKKQDGERRQQMSSRVASGTSTPLAANTPRGIAVGRVGDLAKLGQNWNV